jgi:hypothetical protein
LKASFFVDYQNLTLPDGGYDCNTKTSLKQPLKALGNPDRPQKSTLQGFCISEMFILMNIDKNYP